MKKYFVLMLIAATLTAVNIPFSQYLFSLGANPIFLAGITCAGGAIGVGIAWALARLFKWDRDPLLKGKDFLIMGLINVLDTGANLMLFYGYLLLNGETSALLQSFEIVATALVALLIFRDKISFKVWLAIGIILAGAILLSFNPEEGYAFQPAALLIVATTICWGFANNLAKKLSNKDAMEYTFFKNLTPAVVLLIVAFSLGQVNLDWKISGFALLDGFIAYGLGIIFLILGFRGLSASVGTSVYASNPFIGAIMNLIFFPEVPSWNFYVALVLLLAGETLVAIDSIQSERKARKLQASLSITEPPASLIFPFFRHFRINNHSLKFL
jgi:drug/metabolite transporter (DMT)-like permease